MPDYEIVNIVATADLRQRINLVEISQLPYTTFDQEIYGGRVAYIKTPTMHGKVSIFSSGKIISAGTKRPKQSQQDLNITVKKLVSVGLIKPVNVDAKLRNIVAVQNFGAPVALEEMSLSIDCI